MRLQTHFRSLIPSWKFFDDTGHVPVLLHREIGGGENRHEGPWVRTIPRTKQNLFTLFLNPKGNLAFACQSLLAQLLTDLEDSPKTVQETVSYELVKNLVEASLSSGAKSYQFKLEAFAPLTEESDPLLVSPVYARENDRTYD